MDFTRGEINFQKNIEKYQNKIYNNIENQIKKRYYKMLIDTIKIPLKELQETGLKNPSAYILYGIILYHSYNNDQTWVTNKSLAEEMNISERQIINNLKELEKYKCIANIKNEEKNLRFIEPKIMNKLEYRKTKPNDEEKKEQREQIEQERKEHNKQKNNINYNNSRITKKEIEDLINMSTEERTKAISQMGKVKKEKILQKINEYLPENLELDKKYNIIETNNFTSLTEA